MADVKRSLISLLWTIIARFTQLGVLASDSRSRAHRACLSELTFLAHGGVPEGQGLRAVVVRARWARQLVLELGHVGRVVAGAIDDLIVGLCSILTVPWAQFSLCARRTVSDSVDTAEASSEACGTLRASWALQGVDDSRRAVMVLRTSSARTRSKVLTGRAQITISIHLEVITR